MCSTILPSLSPPKWLELHHGLTALPASSFIAAFTNKSLVPLIQSWCLLLERTKLTHLRKLDPKPAVEKTENQPDSPWNFQKTLELKASSTTVSGE